jgi:hypothetical protein
MRFLAVRARPFAAAAALLMFVLGVAVPAARARMVTTEAWTAAATASAARLRVQGILDREDVRAALTAHGIRPEEARARVDALSDAEIRGLASRIDGLPAGGDAVGAIIGAAVLVFLVLLITDILGFTSVFPFVNRVR